MLIVAQGTQGERERRLASLECWQTLEGSVLFLHPCPGLLSSVCCGQVCELLFGAFLLLEDTHFAPCSVPGPCEPEDLIDGIIFAANYLGSTQLLSERNPSKNIRMMQAQEAVSRVKVGVLPGPRGAHSAGLLWGALRWKSAVEHTCPVQLWLTALGTERGMAQVPSKAEGDLHIG